MVRLPLCQECGEVKLCVPRLTFRIVHFNTSTMSTDLVAALDRAIEMIQRKEVQPAKFNDELKEMYSWVNVAERTEKVYDAISQTRHPPLIERLRR